MGTNKAYWGVLLARLIVYPLKEWRGLKRASFSFALLWVRFVKSIDRLFYISAIWYICNKVNTKCVMIKVIHVHLIYEKKNYYFGSISAIFDVLTEKEIGITKNSLLHAGMTDGSCKITKRAMIIQSHLIRGGKQLFY